jgi:hypothetical protein
MKKNTEINKFIGQYYGVDKITDVIKSKDKTYLGNEKIILICGSQQFELPLPVVENTVTKDKQDLTKLRELRVIPVVEQMLILLVENELTKPEIEYATGPKLMESLNESFKKAAVILWGKDTQELTLMDIQKVLTKHDGKQGISKSASK